MKPGNPRPAPPERAPALRGKEETKTNSRPASIKNSAEKPAGPERKAEKKSQVKKSPGHETNSAPLNDVEKPR
jgi:hypothetical protein